VKQLDAELALKVLDGQAQGRLRDVEGRGGIREGAVLRDGEKVLKPASIDRASLYDSSGTGL
jgi:hypothetical protein